MNKELLEQIREFVIEIFQQSEAGSVTWREATRLVEEIDREIVRPEHDPVGWMVDMGDNFRCFTGWKLMADEWREKHEVNALYTHPPRQQDPFICGSCGVCIERTSLPDMAKVIAERDALKARIEANLKIELGFEDGESVAIDCNGSERDMKRLSARLSYWHELEKRIDGGVRVEAWEKGGYSDTISASSSHSRIDGEFTPNATLILDEGVYL